MVASPCGHCAGLAPIASDTRKRLALIHHAVTVDAIAGSRATERAPSIDQAGGKVGRHLRRSRCAQIKTTSSSSTATTAHSRGKLPKRPSQSLRHSQRQPRDQGQAIRGGAEASSRNRINGLVGNPAQIASLKTKSYRRAWQPTLSNGSGPLKNYNKGPLGPLDHKIGRGSK